MKPVFLLIFLLVIKVSFSQSKKERIDLLTNRVDSLNQVVNSQDEIINDKISQISGLNTKITNLESSISSLNSDISKLNLELQGKENEIATKSQQLSNLQAQLKTKTDSLNIVLSELEKLKPAPKPLVINNTNSNASNQVTQTSSYKSIKIGTQTWMTKNLNVSTFRNGDPIPEAKTEEEWKKAGEEGKPAWCYYDNDPKNGEKYGKLYNWHAVSDPRVLAPNGWHIPSDSEWSFLENYLGEDVGKKMKSTSGWDSWDEHIACSNCKNWNAEYRRKTACHVCKDKRVFGKKKHSGNGTNISGFSGIPGGYRINGTFSAIGTKGLWWSSTEFVFGVWGVSTDAWFRSLIFISSDVNRSVFGKGDGLYVRCLSD